MLSSLWSSVILELSFLENTVLFNHRSSPCTTCLHALFSSPFSSVQLTVNLVRANYQNVHSLFPKSRYISTHWYFKFSENQLRNTRLSRKSILEFPIYGFLYYNSCFNPGVDASEAQSIIRMYRREVGESPKLQKLSLMLSLVAPGNIKKLGTWKNGKYPDHSCSRCFSVLECSWCSHCLWGDLFSFPLTKHRCR
jgi:hypothetical protein